MLSLICLHRVEWTAVAFPSLSDDTLWNEVLLFFLVCLFTHCGRKSCCFPWSACLRTVEGRAVAFPSLPVYALWKEELLLSLVCLSVYALSVYTLWKEELLLSLV